MLFDVQKDPQQLHDLSKNPEYQGILNEMRARLDDWAKETGDVVPENPVPDFFDRRTNAKLYPGKSPSQHAAAHLSGLN